jgi:hypothetical protein
MQQSLNRDRVTPQRLAEEVFRLVGDADYDTAQTALAIARLILQHRDCAAIEFERSNGAS